MEGVCKDEKRTSGTSSSLPLWPSKSHAVIEYRTNASIYYLNMLHYHYISPSQYRSCSLSLTYTHSKNTVQRDKCRCRRAPSPPQTIFDDEMFAHRRSEIEKQNGGERWREHATKEASSALWAAILPLSSALCLERNVKSLQEIT